ncbi:MAG TPA: thioredoxin domain-containing protein [Candidatus Saccharimonadia bacterium]|nr:thioredoxin domain-containing protein [Candidatus Saccharimonadia bacterium]
MSREAKILTAVLVVIVGAMIGLFALANSGQNTPAPVGDKTKLIRDNSQKEGTGAIQLVEFGDYQCPACGAAYPGLKQLMKDYDGKITFYFRNFPLTNLHQNATASANAAESAGDQGKYWEMHDKLYETQSDWSTLSDPTDKFVSYAKDLGLDTDKFKKALTDKQFQSLIDQDVADANALSVDSTPTLYFNGVKYDGKTDYASLRDQTEQLLKK